MIRKCIQTSIDLAKILEGEGDSEGKSLITSSG